MLLWGDRMIRFTLVLALLITLSTTPVQAGSAADCMQALRPGDNLGYLKDKEKSQLSSVVAALPLNAANETHTNVGWLYVNQFGHEWIQLKGAANEATREWYKINERAGLSGIYAVHFSIVPSWLTVESCR